MVAPGAKRTFRFPWRTRTAIRAEVREEFQFHIDMRAAELVESGLDTAGARAQALREFGDQASGAEACVRVDTQVERRVRITTIVGDFWRDTVLGLRLLLRSPGFSVVAIGTLALGIGANAAIYSMFRQTLVQPLPVRAPEELVNLGAPGPKPGGDNCNQAGKCDQVFSYPMFEDLARVPSGFTGIAAHRAFDITVTPGRSAPSEWGMGTLVSGNYFEVLGLNPVLGRLLTAADESGKASVAVLSHDYWRARFNGSSGVVDQTLLVNGHILTIVGVAPEGFTGTTLGIRPAVFMPMSTRGFVDPGSETMLHNRRFYWAYLFARLKPGVSLEAARTAISGPYQRILSDVEAPMQSGLSDQTLARFKAKVINVEDGRRGQSRLHAGLTTPLTLLLIVTGVVQLIACANIANLQLVRAAGRAAEMAVRLSIGGSRGQLVRQLVTESLVLAAAGGLAGLLVAQWTLVGVAMLLPTGAMDTAVTFTLDRQAMLFAGVLAIGAALAFGLIPALHATRPDLLSTLKDQSGQPSGARSASRFRTSLATAQIGLAMALLVSAGLFMRSLANVSNVALGLDTDHLVSFAVAPGMNGYSPDRTRTFVERLEDDLNAMPGVTSASASLIRVLSGQSNGTNVSVEGFHADPDTDTNVRVQGIGPNFFRTLGMTLLNGRAFSPADAEPAPKVAIVNEAFAKKFNLGPNPVGRHVGHRDGSLDTEIVGLVRNAKYSDVKREVQALIFQPYRQDGNLFGMYFYVRSNLPTAQVISEIPRVVAKLDPGVPVRDLMTLPQQVQENVFLDRLISILSTAFAVLATLMAALGLYGVLAYTIAQRTREIGLRMALGADPSQVRGMIFRQVARMTLVGGAAGLAAAIALGTAAKSLLFGLDGFDPLVLSASIVLLALVALSASLVPAMRASRIDPMRALRWD